MKHIACLLLFVVISFNIFSKDFPAAVKEYHVKTIYEDGKVFKEIEMSILIQSKEGAEYSTRVVPFDSYSSIKNIEGHIEDTDGKTIKKLKKKDVYTSSLPSKGTMYSDDLMKYFTLEHDIYPYTVYYKYQLEISQFLFIDIWDAYLIHDIPNNKSVMELWVRDSSEIRIKEQDIKHTKAYYNNEYYVYRWEASDLIPLEESEYFMPTIRNYLPLVYIVPLKINYEIEGSFESWNSFGKFLSKLNSGLHDLPPSEIDKIKELVKDKSDPEKIKILYKYLQDETRYVSVSIEEGGYKAYPASYVVENRYGDCKALSNYFQAVLEQVGIPSYLTTIYSGRKNKLFDKDFPFQQFNHLILFLPNDSSWVDPTSEFICGYVGTWIQNRYALVEGPDSSFLMKTPALQKEDVENFRLIYIKQLPLNQAELKIKNAYKGREYEILAQIKKTFNKERKVELFKDYFIEDGIVHPEEIVITQLEEEPTIILDYQTYSKTLFKEVGDEILLEIPTFNIHVLERVKYRNYDVQVDYPIYMTDKIILEKNDFNKILHIPESEEYKTEYGEYIVRVKEDDRHIVIEKEFLVERNDVALESYEGFRDFFQKAKRIDSNLNIRLSKK